MYRLIVVCGLFLSWNAVFNSGNPHVPKSPVLASDDQDAQVQELLADLAKKNDVTFTLEEAILEDGGMGRIRSFRHRMPLENMDLKAALDDLAQKVPNLSWRADANNPKIIHIIDDHLLNRKGYALESTINDIDFSGTVSGLVDAIAAKGVPVSSVGLFDSHELLVTDFITTVQVKGKSLKVRDALSDFVPLQGRGPILWIAETHVNGSDPNSYIRFRGAPSKTPAPAK
jgi:hypothetical protein